MTHIVRTAVFALALALGACAAPSVTEEPTLWKRLGGEPVVKRVVAETIDRSSSDPRTKRSFDGVKLQNVKDKIVEQICSLTGGGCKYTGDPMDKVHKGLKNTEAEMHLLVQFLRDALDGAGVGTREKNELLAILAPMKRDIVTQ
ncbi:MAG TPA: group 1 truncated hemoglobin [Usitatibacter sp.]|jgi:hemoglobin|nr:group 1 truncated hemoglobin [Usitatibacter sp.]